MLCIIIIIYNLIRNQMQSVTKLRKFYYGASQEIRIGTYSIYVEIIDDTQ